MAGAKKSGTETTANAADENLLDDLPFYLARISLGFQRLVADCAPKESGPHKVKPGMGSVFFALCENDNCIIQTLVDRLRIPNGTLTGILKSMERAGLITMRRCQNDGRAKRIKLTPRAHELRPLLRKGYEQAKAVLQSDLTEDDVDELKRLLGLMLDSIDRAAKRR